MYLPYPSLAAIVLLGVASGLIAAKIFPKHGMGVAGDIIVGIIGAFAGYWLLPRLGVHFGVGLLRASLHAAGGPIFWLFLVRLIRAV